MVVDAHKETMSFQTEVNQLLDLMIHSLYSKQDIFLRELISNSSDALDKLRFEALSDESLFAGDSDLKIKVDIDRDAKTITVTDNGIGMSREEVIQNLGTIARSGTKEFLAKLGGGAQKDSNLIGQFGVGFYSSFIVADSVKVFTRRAGLPADAGVCWQSNGDGTYTIESVDRPIRGTEIILHLKEEAAEFLDKWRIRQIITKYSDHISFPVMMKKEPTPKFDANESDESDESNELDESGEVKAEKTDSKANKDTDEIVIEEEEAVNRATALWTRNKNDITNEEYEAFYKHISHDFDVPLAWTHNRVEGKHEYTGLFYIPKRAPFDMWNRERQYGVKLYVQRVFIMDDADQFIPGYLRFVRGVIDSNDLPLNISREILQSNKVVDSIRTASVKKILSELEELFKDKEKYKTFWKEFGQVLKEGPGEDYSNRERIANLCLFSSTHESNPDADVSFVDYIGRMKEGQDKIYYLTAETFSAAKNSPHLEIFKEKGIEVLLLTERVDEWMISHLTEVSGKHLQCVAKGQVDLSKLQGAEPVDEAEKAEADKQFKDLLDAFQKHLGGRAKEVRLSNRLTASPSCLVVEENDMGMQMQRMLKAAGQFIPQSKPILELNPKHAVILKLNHEQSKPEFNDWIDLLFDQALLADGGQLEDPAAFVARMNHLLLKA